MIDVSKKKKKKRVTVFIEGKHEREFMKLYNYRQSLACNLSIEVGSICPELVKTIVKRYHSLTKDVSMLQQGTKLMFTGTQEAIDRNVATVEGELFGTQCEPSCSCKTHKSPSSSSTSVNNTTSGKKPADRSGNTATGQKPADHSGNAAPGQKPTDRTGNTAPGQKPADRSGNTATGQKPADHSGNTATGQKPTDRSGNTATGQKPADTSGNTVTGETPADHSGNTATGQKSNDRSGSMRNSPPMTDERSMGGSPTSSPSHSTQMLSKSYSLKSSPATLTFSVRQQNLLDARVDAIACFTDKTLTSGFVMKSLLKQDRENLERERIAKVKYDTFYGEYRPKLVEGDVVHLGLQDVPRYVICMVVGSIRSKWDLSECLKGIIRHANGLSISSLALPLLGTGASASIKEREAAAVMFDAVRTVRPANLREVHLVALSNDAVKKIIDTLDSASQLPPVYY